MAKVCAVFTDFAGYPERRKRNTFGGIGYYRMFKPSQCLTNHEVDLRGVDIDQYGTTFEENWENIFKKYDVFWAVHYFHEQNQVAQCYFAKKYDKLLIYDLDDNYLDLPESNPVYEKFFKKEKGVVYSSRNKATLSAAFSFADALTVSTEPLKERMQKHMKDTFNIDKPIYTIPNMNELADFNFTPAPKYKDKIVIGYQGSTSHKEDLLMVLPAIHKLMLKCPNLYMEIMGAIEKKDLDDYFRTWEPFLLERIAMLPSTKVFLDYPKALSEQRWDIGIAPLIDTPFTRSKSHIKWLEYSAFKIPCVASHVYPYFMDIQGKKTIIDGVTGLLCRPPEWEAKLERLILDASLRKRIGQQAYDFIKSDWQYKNSTIQETFDRMLSECKK
jgi:glycosyltransferase involved in cell wall biosynthesis